MRNERRREEKTKTEEARERRRIAALEKYRKTHDPNENRKWTEPVKQEYERQAKRTKCRGKTKFGTDCPAMASPSGSGYCSYHEQQAVEVGEKINPETVRMCCLCYRNARSAANDMGYCELCYAKRVKAGKKIIDGDDDDLMTLPPLTVDDL